MSGPPSSPGSIPDFGPVRPRIPTVSTTEWAMWALALAGLVGDIGVTVHGLELGLRELNPLARGVVEAAGIAGFLAVKLAALGVAVACRSVTPDRFGSVVPAALAVPWLAATLVNVATVLATHWS